MSAMARQAATEEVAPEGSLATAEAADQDAPGAAKRLLSVSVVVVSKDEPKLADTLAAVHAQLEQEIGRSIAPDSEVVVVDASAGRLDGVRAAHPWARWVDFSPIPGAGVTIAHQRNAGVAASRGEVVVFVDSGCVPSSDWLCHLLAPIARGQELVVSGSATGPHNIFERPARERRVFYLEEAATINLAVHRKVFEKIGGFDEMFAYGSDVDFTWRLVDAGIRIRYEPLARVAHDWGNLRRRMRRARQYGAARARLYRKHTERIPKALWEDPVPFVYPLWLLGLPLALKRRSYFLLLALPLWRARRHDHPGEVVLAHVLQGYGSLAEVLSWLLRWDKKSPAGG